MAFFIAAGTISNDIVRKETRNGVLATFRLETGAPRGSKLWIDIECWGHLAGTIAHHARKGREVSMSGRVTQKTWRDKTTGEARHRYVITATDVDLLSEPATSTPEVVPNAVILTGRVEAILPTRSVKSGSVVCFRVSTGRSGNKAGRLELDVEHWTPPQSTPIGLAESIQVTVAGGLAYRGSSTSEHVGQTQIDARSVTVAR